MAVCLVSRCPNTQLSGGLGVYIQNPRKYSYYVDIIGYDVSQERKYSEYYDIEAIEVGISLSAIENT